MRNDARDDDFENVPSLTANARDDDDFEPAPAARERTTVYSRTTPVIKVKGPSTGGLWALVGALFIALAGLGWWSFQQISLMEQQLVATQESFARISEEAAGRLQAITGKVTATESSATSGSEELKQQIKQLQGQLLDQTKQQEQGVAGIQSGLEKRIEQALAQSAAQQATNEQLQAQVKSLTADLAALKGDQADKGKLDAQLKAMDADIAALKKQGNPGVRLESIEQDLVVLKSEVENRPATPNGTNTAEFDSFRGQTTRNLNTLQSQIQNLQQQINTRR
ncbi:MAG: ATPase [Pseudomonas sp.]|uniref:ATPase n=1 Tax=Pseudomonas abieticivorans TaxID=2931382 RepID=UPI0020C12077|nr:ATPase [Pseudomonas sp. PIA16]MDE1163908.1 ATPase [Pseudomonas sp.]